LADQPRAPGNSNQQGIAKHLSHIAREQCYNGYEQTNQLEQCGIFHAVPLIAISKLNSSSP